jgi:hypothetical protein
MMNLPEYVDEDEVKTMFGCADKDGNGRINYKEFTLMCNVPKQEAIPMTLPSTATTSTTTTTTRYALTTTDFVRGHSAETEIRNVSLHL